MSRIGKKPVPVPSGVEVKVKDSVIDIKGPKGILSKNIHSNIKVSLEKDTVLVSRSNDTKLNKSLHGLYRSLISNMIKGVTDGYEKRLELVGVGYKAKLEGKDIVLSLGYSHPVRVKQVGGISFEIDKKGDISVKGIDKELVGQVAADIRSLRKPDAYKGKGIRYSNEVIVKKPGKTGAK